MKKIANVLRKLADLFDPKVKPSTEAITISVEADTSEAMKKLEELRALIWDVACKAGELDLVKLEADTRGISGK